MTLEQSRRTRRFLDAQWDTLNRLRNDREGLLRRVRRLWQVGFALPPGGERKEAGAIADAMLRRAGVLQSNEP